MLLIVFLFVVQIEFLSCILENKNQEDLLKEINRERTNLGIKTFDIHLTLQLAAEKRCANEQQLMETYHRMISHTYRNDNWPRQEQLNQLFSQVAETIYLNGFDIHNEMFEKSFLIINMYRTNFVYIGIALHEYRNFSARCLLYGSLPNSISNRRRLLRLLYILISCGLFLLSLILCSIMNDRRQAKLKQQLEQERIDEEQRNASKKSMTVFIDKDRKSSARRGDIQRMTTGRLGSMIDERPSAVHSFSQSPK